MALQARRTAAWHTKAIKQGLVLALTGPPATVDLDCVHLEHIPRRVRAPTSAIQPGAFVVVRINAAVHRVDFLLLSSVKHNDASADLWTS